MADSYDGPAEVAAGNRRESVTVHARQWTEQGSGRDWAGTIDAGPDLWDFQEDTCRLELPDGSSGDIIITSQFIGAADSPVVFQGSGAPPF